MSEPENKISSTIDTSIIIVNWNGKDYLHKCLSSLFLQSYKNFEVILVDNGSVDGSVKYVLKHFSQVKIIQNNENLGFAKANNIGIKEAFKNSSIKYIVTLNNDTEADPDWLYKLVKKAAQDKDVGIITGKILRFFDRSIIDSAGDFISKVDWRVANRGAYEKDKGKYDKSQEIFSACAAAALYKRELLESVNIEGEYFDEDFISYIEDVDLNIRARLIGWKCFYLPDAIMYHIGSATSSKMENSFKEVISKRNQILTLVKNLPSHFLFLALLKYLLPMYYLKALIRRVSLFFKKKTDKNKAPLRFVILFSLYIHFKGLLSSVILIHKMLPKRHLIKKTRKISNQEIKRWLFELSI